VSIRKIGKKIFYDGPDYGFDRAKSNRADSTVGDDRKSSKRVSANDEKFALAA
jgi:hypothetical protein